MAPISVAVAAEKLLHDKGKATYILDGDNVRHGLNRDLGFTDTERDISIDDIRGDLAYSERGFTGRGLQAATKGEPARLDLAADADAPEKFRADISGKFDVRDVLSDEQLREDLRLLERITGRADWSISRWSNALRRIRIL